MEKTIKIILSLLLFVCLINMPFGYYQLVRFLAMVVFGILAYLAFKQNRESEMIVYIVLAVLFQPLFKIALGRELWNVVDILVGIGLIVSIIIKKKEK